ncbi:hypothetical protein B0A48_04279 [Cryoendolithus antarcticus]|uniref:F-box domain-containing protein n=1 Tax=Cryoendolithus antarcticus TaxID=1507870 RepID=A0A1V8TF70_9PEZI|nr:hypothetical protein B0A48_04279 [Cryoendolithus antarcticus]
MASIFEFHPYPSFPFLSLPHDLRLKIYHTIFTSSPLYPDYIQPRHQPRPVEPAITRVSPFLRSEALPVFYNLYVLPLNLLAYTCSERARLIFSTGSPWYHDLPTPKLRQIRNIRISATLGFWLQSCPHPHRKISGRRVYLDVYIRFYTNVAGKRTYGLRVERGQGVGPSVWGAASGLPVSTEGQIELVMGSAVAWVRDVCDVLVGDGVFGEWTAGDLEQLGEWNEVVVKGGDA